MFARRLDRIAVVCLLSLAFNGTVLQYSTALAQKKLSSIRWKMHIINDQSPYEACGAADFNGDGKIDIFCGDSWYEAPTWTRHKVREVPASGPNPHYHEDFSDSPLDVNGDGRTDIVTCNYFGKRVGWVENPGGDATTPWTEHEIDTPGNMETGELVDINGDGRLDFLPNTGNVVVWYELTRQKPDVVWTKHDLGSEGAGHGVGVGDINRDGRVDIITPKGWYEQPQAAAVAQWPFHAEFDLGAAGIFIHGRDVDGDQMTDIVWGMGHGFGLHWLKQSTAADGKRKWTKLKIDDTFSQVHTLVFANLDREGEPELITGKRVYAHEAEPGATDSSVVFYYHFDRSAAKWVKHTIFHGDPAVNAPSDAKDRWALKDFPRGSAGTGLQMSAIDIDADGDIDLVCPGKSGLYLFENLGR
ncbi:MAG: VCBS repeat-containing protein [Planctomycetaceae bacterium]|nr:VCBS repeat-containing protein [Planctomycetaceae bacterium]